MCARHVRTLIPSRSAITASWWPSASRAAMDCSRWEMPSMPVSGSGAVRGMASRHSRSNMVTRYSMSAGCRSSRAIVRSVLAGMKATVRSKRISRSITSSSVRASTASPISSRYVSNPCPCRATCVYRSRIRTPRPRSASARCRPSESSASRRMPPGWTVSTSVVHAWVASSTAAWIRASPSSTRIAEPSPADGTGRTRRPRPAYHSTAATAEPTRR
ncbi:hypothetical protein SPURM210S_03245 [Streptomyces purpurascens]